MQCLHDFMVDSEDNNEDLLTICSQSQASIDNYYRTILAGAQGLNN